MTIADLPLLLGLRAQAGWNQTEDDLRRFLGLSGDGSFVAEADGVPAGTVCTFVFGSTAWLAMVLVDEALRGRGIGTALMRHALAYLNDLGVERIRLDATPLGRPVYEKLGFVREYDVLRFAGVVAEVVHDDADSVPVADEDSFRRLVAFDAEVIGVDRSAVLGKLKATPRGLAVIERDGRVEGYSSMRPGVRAFQFGPCLAATGAAGERLFKAALRDLQKAQVYVDIPKCNGTPIALAASSLGLTVQRTLTRMCRGPLPAERTEMIWASSGPEKG